MTSWWRRLLTGRGGSGPAPQPPAPPVQAAPTPTGPADPELVAYAWALVQPGFLEFDEVLERVVDHATDLSAGPAEGPAGSADGPAGPGDGPVGPGDGPAGPGEAPAGREAAAEQAVREVWDRRRQEELSWPDEGDHARLSAAFADLGEQGFTTRMNFTCCQNCGHTEIEDERGRGEHSYVFFHAQDSERLVGPDAVLYLAFSYFDDHPDLDRSLVLAAQAGDGSARVRAREQHERLETAVGAQVVGTLERHGLRVDWGGTGASRPAVHVPEWRRPLPR